MSNFMQEWLGANLKDGTSKMHKSKKQRKKVFDMNNARNRDIISNAKAGGLLENDSALEESSIDPSLAEDVFLDKLEEIDHEFLDATIEVLKDKGKIKGE